MAKSYRKGGPSGEDGPRQTPKHFFRGCIDLNYESALKADVTKQDFSVFPRKWYVEATVSCVDCGDPFCFSAEEQKSWYEEYRFYVDSFPNRCHACLRRRRDLKAMRREYDRDLAEFQASDDCDSKSRVVSLVDQLREADQVLPDKILENRERLAAQIARRTRRN